MNPVISIEGGKYGRLLVKRIDTERSGNGKTFWHCLCECGVSKSIRGDMLKSGRAKSCGCFHREISSSICKARKTHGRTGTKIYWTWRHILSRCYKPQTAQYRNYGGRGIIVCERWHKFENFFSDMGHPPSPNHSIDRIDNNGNYEPSNCRWATPKEQGNNTRANKVLFFNGESLTLTQWSEKAGLSMSTVSRRIQRGWDIQAALTIKDGRSIDALGRGMD